MLAGERIGILRQVLEHLKSRFCSGSGVPLGSIEVGVVAAKMLYAPLAVAARRAAATATVYTQLQPRGGNRQTAKRFCIHWTIECAA